MRAALGELRAQGATLAGATPLDRVVADAEPLLARLEAAGADTSEAEAARKQRVREAAAARGPLEVALRRLRRAWSWANLEAGGRFGALAFQTCAAEIGRRRARRGAAEQVVVPSPVDAPPTAEPDPPGQPGPAPVVGADAQTPPARPDALPAEPAPPPDGAACT